MKKLFNWIGNIPTIYWAISVIIGNAVFASIGNIPVIIGFNVIGLTSLLIGVLNRKK